MSAIHGDIRSASINPSRESEIYLGIVSDIVSAVSRNRPSARIECCNGTTDLTSVFCDVLAYKEVGDAFIEAMGDVLGGKGADKMADWVLTAAEKYANGVADLIAETER